MHIQTRQSRSVPSKGPYIAAINRRLLEKGVIRPPPVSQVNPEAQVPVTKQLSTPCTFGAFPQPPLQAHRWTPAPSPSLHVSPKPVHGLPAPVSEVSRRRSQGLFNAPHAPRLMPIPVAPRPTPLRPSDQAQLRPRTRQSSFSGGLEAHLGWGERPPPSYFKLQAEKLRASRAEPKFRPPTLWAGGLSHPPFGLEPPPSSFKPDLEWLLGCEPDYDLPAEQWLQLLRSYGIRPFGPELPRGFPPGGYPPRRLPQPRNHTRPITLRGDWQPSPEFLATLRSPSAPAPQPQRTPLPLLRFRSRISGRVVVPPPGLPCESIWDLHRGLWERIPPNPAEIGMIHRRARQDMWGAGVAFNRACARL